MLSRVLIAIALSAALVSGAAIALLRTEYVGTNLCGYAIATIEEASAAKVHVDRCTVDPTRGQLVIDGLTVGDPGGRLELRATRVFVQVIVRPLLQRIRLERLEIDHAEVKLALDRSGPARPRGAADHQCLPDALDRFELGRVQIRKASLALTSSGRELVVPRLDAQVHGKGDSLQVSLRTAGGSVHAGNADVALESLLADASVDLRGRGKLELTQADLVLADASAFVRGTIVDLCQPRVDGTAKVRLDDLGALSQDLIPGKLAGVGGSLAADVTFTLARGKPHANGQVHLRGGAIEGFLPGDLAARFDWTPARLSVGNFELPVGRGSVSGSIELALTQGLPLSAELQIRDLELQEVLRRLTQPHAWVLLRTSGHISLKGTGSPFALAGNANLEIPDFAVLDRAYDARKGAPQRLFEMGRTRLATGISLDARRIALPSAMLDVDGSRVAVDGALNFDLQRGLELAATSDSLPLAALRGHVGALTWGGTVVGLKGRVYGPYGNPRIEGGASIRDFRMLDLSLGTVSGEGRLEDSRLALMNLAGKKGATEFGGEVVLDFSKPETPMTAHLEVPKGRVHDLVDLLVAAVPALRTIGDKANVDGSITAVIDARGPASRPDGEGRATFADLNVFGQKFPQGEARATLHGKEPRLRVEDLTLRRGNGTVTLAGDFGPDYRLEMDAQSHGLTLQDVDVAAAARMQGPLEASARIRGVASHPLVEAKASFAGAKAGKAPVGDGRFSLSLDGDAMRWDGQVGPHRLAGRATIEDGSVPYTGTLALRFGDLSGLFQTFLPEAELRGGALEADVAISGDLLRVAESEGTVQVGRLAVERQEMTIENDGPGELAFGPEGIDVKRLAVRAPYTSATLQGRAAYGALDLRLVASVDGRLLQGLFADLEHAAGTCLVQASMGGTFAAPLVLGNVRIESGEMRLRGLPFAAREMNGSISFSQDALVIDELHGKLNNGEAKVSGGASLHRFVPQKIDFAAHLGEASVRFQDNLSATVEGDVTLYGPPLEPVVGGSVTLSRMTYTEPIDIERSLLDFSRRPLAPRVLVKSSLIPHFDLDVQLGRAVRIENNLARADLKGEVKVTGTSRSLGLLGSVNTVHGVAQFRGNDFQIEQGVVTFTDRQRIRPSFDLQAVTQIRSASTDYKIHLHGFGTPTDPHLTLSSEPALAEADVGFLLTFGFVSSNLQESKFNAADSGLAIGVEALNKVTGFSEEMRRFIPKNSILRDPNLDFTSDFSGATSRIEPMARFRSHLLTDKIDLKVLQTLSATQRRYRGVLAYQVSDALSGQLQLDNEHLTTGTDFGADLKFKWEGE
jgi:autotransporter translocation and assembly factor TamB